MAYLFQFGPAYRRELIQMLWLTGTGNLGLHAVSQSLPPANLDVPCCKSHTPAGAMDCFTPSRSQLLFKAKAVTAQIVQNDLGVNPLGKGDL